MADYQIEHSPIWPDVTKIIYSDSKPVKFEFKGMLHTEKYDIPIFRIKTIDVERDYINNLSDYIFIEFDLPLGDYATKLYPYRGNLEFTIKRIRLQETAGGKEPNTGIFTERLKAVFNPQENRVVNASQTEQIDAASLNIAEWVTVKLQLLNRSIEPLRIKTVDGIYRDVTVKQIIHNLLAGESNKVLVDGKPSIDGIDIVEPDNKESRKHINIPTGTKITSIPSYLQEISCGVYNAGIGTYLQTYNKNKLWFVYPFYNLTRFSENVPKLIIYELPKERFKNSDRTYFQDGKILNIVATNETKYSDSAETDYMNNGSGVRMSDANTFMKKPIVITDKGPKGVRAHLNFEVVNEERKDGLNYAPISASRITSNPYSEYSKVLSRNIARLDITWENADPLLLYPGMPCKYVFLSKNKPVELKGILYYVHAFTALQGQGIDNNQYRTVCQLTIAVDRYSHIPKVDAAEPVGNF